MGKSMNYDNLDWEPHPMMGGDLAEITFDNGITISVLRGGMWYTKDGTYELYVLHGGDETLPLKYDDPLEYLSRDELNSAIKELEKL